MGSKKYIGKTCAYCGQKESSESGDHVFAREFFLVGRRENLPQVPACNKCNHEKSILEHNLTAVLPFGGKHEDAKKNLETFAPKRLGKNQKLHIELQEKQRSGLYFTESGIAVESSSIPIEAEKLICLFEYILRGLAYYHMDVRLEKDDAVNVIALTEAGEKYFENNLFRLNAKQRVKKSWGNGTVSYEGAQGVDDPKVTVWRIEMYGGIQLGGSESPYERSKKFGGFTSDKRINENVWRRVLFQV
jgi:hypothetical protein